VATHSLWAPPTQIASPAVALASDRHGVALAWSMPTTNAPSRIHIARLGGAIRVLPARSEGEMVTPVYPSLAAAPGNDGFVAAWIETNRGPFGMGRPLGTFAFLDAGLNPAPPAFLPANEVTSPVIVRGYPNTLVYSAIKSAVTSLTRTLAAELGPRKIRVNAVAPGSVPTPGAVGINDAAEYERRAKTIPLRRLGRESDNDKALAFLLSRDAEFINGAILQVDGGIAASA
jgi:hypothetical protein